MSVVCATVCDLPMQIVSDRDPRHRRLFQIIWKPGYKHYARTWRGKPCGTNRHRRLFQIIWKPGYKHYARTWRGKPSGTLKARFNLDSMPMLRSSPNLNQLGTVSKSQPCLDCARHRAKWNWVRCGESTVSKLGLNNLQELKYTRMPWCTPEESEEYK